MAENAPTGPLELGADMDYREHEHTYSLFIGIVKYSALAIVSLLAAMAFGVFTAAGFISATLLFVLMCIVGGYLLR